jgi:hypothetical protein
MSSSSNTPASGNAVYTTRPPPAAQPAAPGRLGGHQGHPTSTPTPPFRLHPLGSDTFSTRRAARKAVCARTMGSPSAHTGRSKRRLHRPVAASGPASRAHAPSGRGSRTPTPDSRVLNLGRARAGTTSRSTTTPGIHRRHSWEAGNAVYTPGRHHRPGRPSQSATRTPGQPHASTRIQGLKPRPRNKTVQVRAISSPRTPLRVETPFTPRPPPPAQPIAPGHQTAKRQPTSTLTPPSRQQTPREFHPLLA